MVWVIIMMAHLLGISSIIQSGHERGCLYLSILLLISALQWAVRTEMGWWAMPSASLSLWSSSPSAWRSPISLKQTSVLSFSQHFSGTCTWDEVRLYGWNHGLTLEDFLESFPLPFPPLAAVCPCQPNNLPQCNAVAFWGSAWALLPYMVGCSHPKALTPFWASTPSIYGHPSLHSQYPFYYTFWYTFGTLLVTFNTL